MTTTAANDTVFYRGPSNESREAQGVFLLGSTNGSLGTRVFDFKGTIPNAAATYSSGQSIGGLVTVATGLGAGVVMRPIAIRLRALATDVTTAGAMATSWFDANPSASTITDGVALAVPKADVPKLNLSVAAAALTAVTGAPTLLSTSSPPVVTTDASGNIYFALTAAASVIMATSNSIFFSLEALA